jgi:hypothetical protein
MAGDPHAAPQGAQRLHEAGALRDYEEQGWARDRANPHARERAFDLACRDPPAGDAIAEIQDVGNTCPECPSED